MDRKQFAQSTLIRDVWLAGKTGVVWSIIYWNIMLFFVIELPAYLEKGITLRQIVYSFTGYYLLVRISVPLILVFLFIPVNLLSVWSVRRFLGKGRMQTWVYVLVYMIILEIVSWLLLVVLLLPAILALVRLDINEMQLSSFPVQSFIKDIIMLFIDALHFVGLGLGHAFGYLRIRGFGQE